MSTPRLSLSRLHRTPYGWPLRQLRVPQAHRVTRGSSEIVVAVIDLGYRPHPDHEGHLWVNPHPANGDVHGWDCHDDDATLEYNLHDAHLPYYQSHHAFIVGEVIACAPECKVMVVRVGYGNPDSWWRGIDYAAEHGARILIIPHGYLTHGDGSSVSLFDRGNDFCYACDNPQVRRALDDAYDAGCLIFKATADNRGRRVAFDESAFESVVAVGSTNRHGEPSDVCGSADYVEIAAPAGQRSSDDPLDKIWSTDGDGGFMPFTGGCMASGFAGGAAALVWSRFPACSHTQIRQILRNVADAEWNSQLGWGLPQLDKAVDLDDNRLCQRVEVKSSSCQFLRKDDTPWLKLCVENRGAYDIDKAIVVAYSGDPLVPAAPGGTLARPIELRTRQLGHAITAVRGLHSTEVEIELAHEPAAGIWLQTYSLDFHGNDMAHTVRVPRRYLHSPK